MSRRSGVEVGRLPEMVCEAEAGRRRRRNRETTFLLTTRLFAAAVSPLGAQSRQLGCGGADLRNASVGASSARELVQVPHLVPSQLRTNPAGTAHAARMRYHVEWLHLKGRAAISAVHRSLLPTSPYGHRTAFEPVNRRRARAKIREPRRRLSA